MPVGVMFALSRASELPPFAAWAEASGFSSLWIGEGRLERDAVSLLGAASTVTSRITLGAGVLPLRTRHPALVAMTARTLAELSGGRFVLGLGAWWEPLATRVGLPRHRPLRAMREFVETIKQLAAGEEVTMHGEFVDVDRIRLDAATDQHERPASFDVVIGAVGPRMLALAGAIADGAMLDFLLPPSYSPPAVAHFEAQRPVGSRPGAFPQLIAACVDDEDPGGAEEICRRFLALYIGQQPHIAEHCGATEDVVGAVRQAVRWPTDWKELEAAAQLVPMSLVRDVAACGTADTVRSKLGAFAAAGATELVVLPLGDPMSTLEPLAVALAR